MNMLSIHCVWYYDTAALLSWNELNLRWLFVHSFMDILNFIINLFINYLISIKLFPFIAFVCEFIVIAEYITNLNWIIIHIDMKSRMISIYISLFQAAECSYWVYISVGLAQICNWVGTHLAKSLCKYNYQINLLHVTSLF